MRILFLSTWHPYPADNGSKIRVDALVRALARAHDVTLVSFAFDTAVPEDGPYAKLVTAVHTIAHNPFVRSSFERATSFASPSPIVDRPLPAMAALVGRLHDARPFEVVIASTTVMAAYALQVKGAARVLEEHNLHANWAHARHRRARGWRRRLRTWIVWQKRRRYDRRLFRQFDLVTMVSPVEEAATRRLLAGSDGRCALVPNGVDCNHHRPALYDRRPHTLVYNGALTYAANFNAMRYFLNDIYPAIRMAVPDVRLFITGAHDGVDLASLPLDNVTLTGLVDDIRSVVGTAEVAVAPIIDGAGTRLKVLEAMALGTPVVATGHAVAGLDVTDRHDVWLADGPAAFATAVITLLGDAGHRQALAAAARTLVESRYDWASIGRHFVDLVETTHRATHDNRIEAHQGSST